MVQVPFYTMYIWLALPFVGPGREGGDVAAFLRFSPREAYGTAAPPRWAGVQRAPNIRYFCPRKFRYSSPARG